MTNEDRFRVHLTPVYEERALGSFCRDALQDFLDSKAQAGLSLQHRGPPSVGHAAGFSHGSAGRPSAAQSRGAAFIPREAPRPEHTVMTLKEVNTCFAALEQRERLIAKLAILAGMRPGEILGLKWGHRSETHANIRQRLYQGKIDSPKTSNSVRKAALAEGLLDDIREWRAVSANTSEDAWVFPSETGKTPVSRDNLWRRHIGPQLEKAGLGFVDFHVMRRTHATHMNEIHDDPKLVADQLGHTLDVSQNVYTRASVARRKEAVDALESAVK